MTKQRAVIYILMIILLLTLAGCIMNPPTLEATPTVTLNPSLMDRSLLTGEPCPAPCWYGLELGKTTKEQALERVKTLSFIDPTHISETDYQYSWGEPQERDISVLVSLPCRQPQEDTCAKLEFVDNLLKAIYPIPNYSLSFGDVVAHLGPPDYFRLGPVYPDGPQQCLAVLIWKERSIWVSYFSGPNDKKENQVKCGKQDGTGIRSSFPVEQIIYGLPENAVFVRVPSPGDYPWTGFSEP
ncbi:MAG: hypothetical protein P8Y03_24860 [Anaerolineales bacterium]|jgi:hypothetical protein